MSNVALSVSGLSVDYEGATALRDVTLAVESGTSLAVIGPNGSGKSTLLKAIAGVATPSRGTVTIAGGAAPAFVLQATDVDRSVPISVRETVSMARYASLGLFGRFRTQDRDAVSAAIDRMRIIDLADRQLHDLSGGQRQRVLVAQGLAQQTSVLLLDEPVTGLDLRSRSAILEVIDEQCAAGQAVVMTTHDLEEARRCDQVLLLAGAPVALGTPDEVLSEDHLVRAFGGRFVRVGDEFVLDDPHHHTH